MKTTYIFAITIIATMMAAGGYVYLNRSDAETSQSNTAMSSEIRQDTQSTEQSTQQGSGKYVDYSEQVVAVESGTKLLFFHAPWCPQCRELERSIISSDIPEDTTVFKVDYDSNQDLRQKYGVTIQTTVVLIDDNNDKIDSYVAYESPTFQNVKEALLQ